MQGLISLIFTVAFDTARMSATLVEKNPWEQSWKPHFIGRQVAHLTAH